MRLAAAEVCLQGNNRIASVAAKTTRCVQQELLPALRQKGATEELLGLSIFIRCLVTPDLMQVSSELGLLVSAGCYVRMRCDDLTPRLQARSRLTLRRSRCRSPAHRARLFSESRPQ